MSHEPPPPPPPPPPPQGGRADTGRADEARSTGRADQGGQTDRADRADQGCRGDRGCRHGGTGDGGRNHQWVLALLPAFPLVLLILRLWYLSGQELQTMLLLVQYVSPLGLVSTMLITLLWSVPAVILVTRALGGLLRVSRPNLPGSGSWLLRGSARIPDWVVVVAGLLGGLIWQLRFLPALLMLLLIDLGLQVRHRQAAHPLRVRLTCTALPVVAAVVVYAWCGPAIVDAVRYAEPVTALLLCLPPTLTIMLTGPIPVRAARPVTHAFAVAGVVITPLLVSGIFLGAPVLPTVALEIDDDPQDTKASQVLVGEIVAVDDTMTTILHRGGILRFIPNAYLRSKVLCPSATQPPYSRIDVHGWQVEQTPLSWMAPQQPRQLPDPRCQGRPLG